MKSSLFAFLTVLISGQLAHAQPSVTSPLPEEAVEMMSRLVGTWTTRGDRNGQPVEGLYQAQWNPTKTGLIYSSSEGRQSSNGVGYWDGSTNELVENWAGHSLSAELRYRPGSENEWTGTGVVFTHAGERLEGPAGVKFEPGKFNFFGDAGKEQLTSVTTRVPFQDSLAGLQSWANFIVGGTWVNKQGPHESRHTYTWRPGKKVLALDRQGGETPGLSLITADHDAECIRWYEVDDSGMHGSAILLPIDSGVWQLIGNYRSNDQAQFLRLTVKRVGPDELHANGVNIVNGIEEQVQDQVWKRER